MKKIIAVFLALFIFVMPVMAQDIHEAAKEDINEAVTMFRNVKKKYPNHGNFQEQAMIFLGYILMYKTGEIKKAIEIFKLVVEAYPNSANAYDSLGEAYLVNGDKENAIKNYEKTLSLDNSNQWAKSQLVKLRSKD